MEFLDEHTEGLDRVLMVRGGGREIITIYSWHEWVGKTPEENLFDETHCKKQLGDTCGQLHFYKTEVRVHFYQFSWITVVLIYLLLMGYQYLRGPDWESVSDLGNGAWPNSMKLGEDIDLDELLLNSVLFVVVLSSFQFFRGSPILGSQSTKKHPYES